MDRWRWGMTVSIVLVVVVAILIILLPQSNEPNFPPAPPGEWKMVFEDDFAGPEKVPPTGEPWFAYSGIPGDNPDGLWQPENLSVGNGQMLLRTTRQGSTWVTAGAGNSIRQTFGRWEVRMRMPYSENVKFVVQLWPAQGWPPNISFAERGNLNEYNAFMHWGTPADQERKHKLQTIDRLTDINMDDWHDVGVMWRPESIQYTIDGRVWASVEGSNVPHQDMELAIQTEGTNPAEDGDPQPPDMQVSNVKIWSWSPASQSLTGSRSP